MLERRGGADSEEIVNFADGRIKGYGLTMPNGGAEKTFFVLYVRRNTDYGVNAFVDNVNGTVTEALTASSNRLKSRAKSSSASASERPRSNDSPGFTR